MSTIDRRDFLKRGATATALGVTLSGPFGGLLRHLALAADGADLLAPNNGGYGPLFPVADQRDGVVRLRLPKGFGYRSFGLTGQRMEDGVNTPGRHDGMAAFAGPNGKIRLVRNHEVNGNRVNGAFGDRARAYDRSALGGTTTLEVTATADSVRSWVSLNGTQMNCAGGATPWNTWITCEETVNGPDVGADFTGTPNTALEQKHGYIYEVPAAWGPGDYHKVLPVRSAGRFAHEAVAVDPVTGHLYMTEDDFGFPAGFYRYLPPTDPRAAGGYRDGGVLQMLRAVGHPGLETSFGQEVGDSYTCDWVTIADPDPDMSGMTNNEAIQAVANQGFEQGAAKFARLEGLVYHDGIMYIDATEGGDVGDASAGYGNGYGQIWAYDTGGQTLTLVFESPGPDVLDLPDNLEISPRGSLVLCEDGTVDNYIRGLTAAGKLFDFAENLFSPREEFAGATFSPNGNTLFVNMQASNGLTYAIWGAFRKGAF
jgi:uncharacterized protein